MKKSLFSILLIAVFSFGLVSCNQAQKMIDAADQITIKCDPEVLEVVAGNIDATVSVTFVRRHAGVYFAEGGGKQRNQPV